MHCSNNATHFRHDVIIQYFHWTNLDSVHQTLFLCTDYMSRDDTIKVMEQPQSLARTHARTHAHTHTHTHANAHAHTHTHTHTPLPPRLLVLSLFEVTVGADSARDEDDTTFISSGDIERDVGLDNLNWLATLVIVVSRCEENARGRDMENDMTFGFVEMISLLSLSFSSSLRPAERVGSPDVLM